MSEVQVARARAGPRHPVGAPPAEHRGAEGVAVGERLEQELALGVGGGGDGEDDGLPHGVVDAGERRCLDATPGHGADGS